MEKKRFFQFLFFASVFCVAAFSRVSAGENLISNPRVDNVIETEEARKIIPEDQHHGRIRMWGLLPGEMLPEGWGIYNGGGFGSWGATDEQAYSGEHSVFLEFRGLQKFQDPERELATLWVLTEQVEVEGESVYEFSFMVKGDIPVVSVRGHLWNEEGERRNAVLTGLRREGSALRGQDRGARFLFPSTEDWTAYSFTVQTVSDSVLLRIMLGIESDRNPPLSEGQGIYIDDLNLKKR